MQRFHKTRIAPTPSGYLHRGNIASFLLTQSLAQKYSSKILLRIDDGDAQRYRPAYAQHIFDTLVQMGVYYDEGPRSIHELETVWSQRQRLHLYEAALQKLIESEKVFACTCSRTTAICVCESKQLSINTSGAALRLRTTDAPVQVRTLNEAMITVPLPVPIQNFIVRKRDGLPAYQLCSVVDDLHFGIDLIVRGQDLWPSTLAQLQLAHALGEERFLRTCFVHHPLLLDEKGEKLSKSAGNYAAAFEVKDNLSVLQNIAKDWYQQLGLF